MKEPNFVETQYFASPTIFCISAIFFLFDNEDAFSTPKFQFIPLAVYIHQLYRRINLQFLSQFGNKHIKTTTYNHALVFPYFFLKSAPRYDDIGCLGEYQQQFIFFDG